MMQTVILSRSTFVKWTALENYLNVIIKVVGLSMQSMVPLRVTGIIRLVGSDFFFDKYNSAPVKIYVFVYITIFINRR